MADVFDYFAAYACYSDNIGLYHDIRIAQSLTSFALSAIPVVGDLYMLASAYTGQDLVTGARLSQHDRQVMAALSVISLGTMILGGAGLGEQEAAVAIRAETELGDLLRVGEAATSGAEDTLRAGADEAHAADAVASEAGSADLVTAGTDIPTLDESAYPRGTSGNEGELYRNLRPDENPAQGLFAKDPTNTDVSIAEHVRNGSKPGWESRYISTTKDLHTARIHQILEKTRIAVIDQFKVPGPIYDLTTEGGRLRAGIWYPSREYSYAVSSQEVVVEGPIPAGAIIGILYP